MQSKQSRVDPAKICYKREICCERESTLRIYHREYYFSRYTSHSIPDSFTQRRASRTPYYISLTFLLWFKPLSYARESVDKPLLSFSLPRGVLCGF